MSEDYGVHGQKLLATKRSEKLPPDDLPMLEVAISKYETWLKNLRSVQADSVEDLVTKMVSLLNEYKYWLELNLIFDSKKDFLYRQKGQLKLDNTVIEEFIPILIRRCLELNGVGKDLTIDSQSKVYSTLYFESNMIYPGIGGGLKIKCKDQDFSISRKVYLKSSYNNNFPSAQSTTIETNIGYVLAEIKTNLDKTMFQEAAATAHDVKQAVVGAKYYLLCEYLDMTPISSNTTDIDEVLILRKAKRMPSDIRSKFNTYEGRMEYRKEYVDKLNSSPYSKDVFLRFVNHILSLLIERDEGEIWLEGFF